MTGYYAQLQFGNTHTPCVSPLFPMLTQRPTATAQQPPTISRRLQEEEQRTTAAAQQVPTFSRRPSPNEVQPLMIYPQQALTALLQKLGKRPKKLGKPYVKPTYHKKKKTQSYHQQVPVTNESD